MRNDPPPLIYWPIAIQSEGVRAMLAIRESLPVLGSLHVLPAQRLDFAPLNLPLPTRRVWGIRVEFFREH